MKISHKLIAIALACCLSAGAVWADEGRMSTKDLRHGVKKGDINCMAPYALRLLDGEDTDVDIQQGRGLLLQAANANKPLGKYGLALCSFYGFGGIDLPQAYNYYLSAAETGCREALAPLGHCYNKGIGTRSNYHKAMQCFMQLAPYDLEAQCMILELIDYRRTPFPGMPQEVGQNTNQTLELFKRDDRLVMSESIAKFLRDNFEMAKPLIEAKLAAKHDFGAMSAAELCNWGHLYALAKELGADMGKDGERRMMECFKRSADKKYVSASIAMAKLQAQREDPKGIAVLRGYSDAGYLEAKLALLEYFQRKQGREVQLEQDYVAILKELRQLGYTPAVTKLAEYYASIDDGPTAWQYTLEAADAGEAMGCYRASEFYRTGKCNVPGITTAPNPEKAYEYLNTLCSDLPDTDYRNLDMCKAFTTLGNMYLFGKGTAKDKNQAQEWYGVALNTTRGNKAEAAYRLGTLYVETSDKRAEGLELLKETLNSGNPKLAKGAKYLIQKYSNNKWF